MKAIPSRRQRLVRIFNLNRQFSEENYFALWNLIFVDHRCMMDFKEILDSI